MGLFKRVQEDKPTPPWGVLFSFGMFALAFFFMTFVGLALAGFLAGDASNTVALLLGWTIGGSLIAALILLVRRQDLAPLGLVPASFPLLTAFGIGLGLAIALDLIAIIVAGEALRPPELATFGATPGLLAWVLAAIFLLIVQPVAEELVFRGAMLPVIWEAANGWSAIIVTASFYAIFHQLLYPAVSPGVAGLWYGLIEPLIVGLMLGILRAGTGSTWVSIVAHLGVGMFALLKTVLIVGAAAT